MRMRHAQLELRLRTTFRIAHGASDVRRTLLLRLDDGWGQAAPVAYHGETLERVVAALEAQRALLEGLDDPAAIQRVMARVEGSQAARAAVDMALHDLLGRRLGLSVRALLGLSGLDHPLTSFTLPIAALDELRQLAREASHYPILKLKLGGDADLASLRAVREEVPGARLRVDANGGWTAEQALALLPALAELGVELIEQPLPPGDLDGLRRLRGATSIPVYADESIKTSRDIPPLAGLVDGVNIKLQKTGGIAAALAAIHTARAHGLQVMLGCMIESSLGVSAALALAPLVDELDLDAPLLIANDPFSGLGFEGARLVALQGAGLGVEPREPIPGLE